MGELSDLCSQKISQNALIVWWTQWLGQRQNQKVKITEYENISTECDYLWFVVQTYRDDMSQLKPILEDYSSWRLNSATIKQKQNVIISDVIFKYLNYLQQQLCYTHNRSKWFGHNCQRKMHTKIQIYAVKYEPDIFECPEVTSHRGTGPAVLWCCCCCDDSSSVLWLLWWWPTPVSTTTAVVVVSRTESS